MNSLSPNHDPRPDNVPVDILLVHYTGMPDCASALTRLCDPAAQVSAHYVIDEDGTIYRLVPEDRRAWHAGLSYWQGDRDINSRSIGVELVNPGHEWGYRAFPAVQIDAFAALALDLMGRHGILPHRVLGHADVAPSRKEDPGELFDWQSLARQGVGVWPEPQPADDGPLDPNALQTLLARYGYDTATPAALTAFQRHFHAQALGCDWTPETARRLRALVRHAEKVARTPPHP
jgi:N-acetylmuramoyl-L-alanine amidase